MVSNVKSMFGSASALEFIVSVKTAQIMLRVALTYVSLHIYSRHEQHQYRLRSSVILSGKLNSYELKQYILIGRQQLAMLRVKLPGLCIGYVGFAY